MDDHKSEKKINQILTKSLKICHQSANKSMD